MSFAHANEPIARKPLLLWPGVIVVTVQWLAWAVVPLVLPGATLFSVIGGVASGLLVVLWWLFLSRAPWSERVGALVLMVVALFGTSFIVHESIANGFQGMLLYLYGIPTLSLALVAGVAAGRRLPAFSRRAVIAAAILLGCGVFALIRTGGIYGEDATSDFHWRWTPTPEERLLASDRADLRSPATAAETPSGSPPAVVTPAPASRAEAAKAGVPIQVGSAPTAYSEDSAAVSSDGEWPGFRGPERDSVVRGVRLETDWSRKPPVALWRRPVGPGWSSFAVHGNFFYTQEQRGDDEVVSSYNLATGEPLWRHRDAARFWESNGGAGPRGTPALSHGRVYTLGATGLLNALDARDGSVVWSRNAQSDTGAPMPGWGFSGSPLVVDDVVIVAVSGRLAAYDAGTGTLRWSTKTGGGGYSSPHLVTLDGVAQVLLQSGGGATSVSPADGSLLWQNGREGISIVQPAAADGDVLVTAGDAMGGVGVRRLSVAHGSSGWKVEERWTSRGLKPYFNDFVVHKGYAYGFDGSILACIDLKDGTRKWKGGRYGNGQIVLLPDQDLLLAVSEEGELALVEATPDRFMEISRVPAIEGKTWNHPALVGDVLLVRNGEEMAAFRLPIAGR